MYYQKLIDEGVRQVLVHDELFVLVYSWQQHSTCASVCVCVCVCVCVRVRTQTHTQPHTLSVSAMSKRARTRRVYKHTQTHTDTHRHTHTDTHRRDERARLLMAATLNLCVAGACVRGLYAKPTVYSCQPRTLASTQHDKRTNTHTHNTHTHTHHTHTHTTHTHTHTRTGCGLGLHNQTQPFCLERLTIQRVNECPVV